MFHYHLIPMEAKQFFSSILVVFKIKLRKLYYTEIDLGSDIRSYYKITKKIFLFFGNQGVMKHGEMQRKMFSIFGPITILSVL